MFDEINRIPPQSLETERTVLGSMLISPSALDEAAERLVEDCFYSGSNRLVFSTIVEMSEKNVPVDIITLSHALESKSVLNEVGGSTYLAELAESIAVSANIEHYCDILTGKMMLRKLITTAGETVLNAFSADVDPASAVDAAETAFLSISETVIKNEIESSLQLMPRFFQDVENYHKGIALGVRTGFIDLDNTTCGMQKSDLIILAGRPSMGKTAFAISLTLNTAIKYRTKVLIFSLEMSKAQLINRMMCAESRINAHELRSGKLPKRDLLKLSTASGPISEAGIYIDDTPSASVSTVRAKARRHKKRHGLDLIIIDYLQLMDGKGENRQQEITKISRGLKGVAKELDVPVIALSQLSRGVEMRPNHRPQLSDLRESGAIEQDADVVMFVYRDEVYNKDDKKNVGKAELIIAKQRNGPLDTVNLSFIKQYARFDNLAVITDNLECFRGGVE